MQECRTPKKRFPQRLAAVGLAFGLTLLSLGQQVSADNLSRPVYAYGESLTASQKTETARLLDVNKDALEMQVNIDELNELLRNKIDYYQVYSSVYLAPKGEGEGVEVEIVTPKTITTITPRQYENAAITAGATNMTIRVASVKAVDGSGALAGVYKAFRGTTGSLPEKNVAVAQDELKTTSKISKENEGKKGFSDDLLNAAIAEMKAQISTIKNQNNGTINNSQIADVINNVVNNYNLNGVLTEGQVNSLRSLMDEFSKIKLSDEQIENLKALGTKLLNKGGELMEKVQADWGNLSPETKQEIGGFFQKLLQAIQNFFASLFK